MSVDERDWRDTPAEPQRAVGPVAVVALVLGYAGLLTAVGAGVGWAVRVFRWAAGV